MARDGTTITVNVRLNIDENTAEVCLKLVEAYCNQNRKMPIGYQRVDGSYKFTFEEDRTQ